VVERGVVLFSKPQCPLASFLLGHDVYLQEVVDDALGMTHTRESDKLLLTEPVLGGNNFSEDESAAKDERGCRRCASTNDAHGSALED
jgi:hypothetical protein